MINLAFVNRKKNLPQFKELFDALFKIDDKNLQRGIVQAINGTSQICNCGGIKTEVCEVETQTCKEDFEMNSSTKRPHPSDSANPIKKRKKRRDRTGPRVEQQSTNEIKKKLIHNSIDKLEKRVEAVKTRNKETSFKLHNDEKYLIDAKKRAEDCKQTIDALLAEFQLETIPFLETRENIVMENMKIEWETCLKFSKSGLLPIHDAIEKNDYKKLKRQLYVFKYRKENISHILTRDDEMNNLLQFAVKNNCSIDMFKEITNLVEFNLLFDKDSSEKNLIHLSIANIDENNITLFKFVLGKFNESKFFTDTDENGQTVLHMCINENKAIFCHLILEHIDFLLGVNSNQENIDLNRTALLNHYNRYYNNNMEINKTKLNNKMKVVNQKELKHGWSPVMLAVKNKNIIFIKMLLFHSADTTITDHSNLSCLDHSDGDAQIQTILSSTKK